MSAAVEIGVRKCLCGSLDVAMLCDGTERMHCQECGEIGFSGKGGDTELAYNRAAMGWNYRVELGELQNWNRVAERILRRLLPEAETRCLCAECLLGERPIPEWTPKKPDKAGWWWFRARPESPAKIMEIFPNMEGSLMIPGGTIESLYELFPSLVWAGPIKEPAV